MTSRSAEKCSQGIIKWYYLLAGAVVLTEKELVLRKVLTLKLEAGRIMPNGFLRNTLGEGRTGTRTCEQQPTVI
jgi:hypothetical protein